MHRAHPNKIHLLVAAEVPQEVREQQLESEILVYRRCLAAEQEDLVGSVIVEYQHHLRLGLDEQVGLVQLDGASTHCLGESPAMVQEGHEEVKVLELLHAA